MLTTLEHDTLTVVVASNDGRTAKQIGERLKSMTGRALAARDLQALLCGLVDRRMLTTFTAAALVPAYELTAAGVLALETEASPPAGPQCAGLASSRG